MFRFQNFIPSGRKNKTRPLTEFFKNGELNREFHKKGFVIMRNEVKEWMPKLKRIQDKYLINDSVEYAFDYSTISLSEKDNIGILVDTKEYITQFSSRYFHPFRAHTPIFLTKRKQNSQTLDLHQDWSFTNEALFPSATVWTPLCDTGRFNGNLFVVPGSHHLSPLYRSESYKAERIYLDSEWEKQILEINTQEGDVVIFNPAILHGSFPNPSNQDRVVLAYNVLPLDAPFIYAEKENEEFAKQYYIDDLFLLQNIRKISNPKERHLVQYGSRFNQVPYKHIRRADTEVLRIVKNLKW